MMQNLNRKNSLEDYGAEPSALVWEKIEKRLPPPSGKNRRWLIWSFAAMLVTGIFLSAYFFDIDIKLKKKESVQKAPVPFSNGGTSVNSPSEKNQLQNNAAEKTQPWVTENVKNNDAVRKEKTSPGENVIPSQPEKKSGMSQNKIVAAQALETKTKTVEEKKTIPSDNISITADERTLINKVSPIGLAMIPMPGDLYPTPSTTNMQSVKKKYSISRWQWSVLGGVYYNYRVLNFPSSGNNSLSEGEQNYLSENEKGIQTFALETGVGYSLTTHFSLNFGVNYFTAGQERTESKIYFSGGTAGTPNTLYAVSTSAGIVTANGQQVDNAFFNNNDTTLFPSVFNVAGPSPADSTTQNLKLRQEFSFIGFPLLIQYQTAEHRFTPYIGLGFSVGYIIKERVTVNDKVLDYSYRKNTNDIIFFAEAQAGVKYRINNKLFLKLQPSLRYGLNSLSGDDSIIWIPYSVGINGGIDIRF